MSTSKKYLLLLYVRLKESILTTRGPQKVQFDVPISYLNDEYKDIGREIASIFREDASEKIKVKEIPIPQFGEILSFPRDEKFSIFIPWHGRLAGKLIEIFLGMKNVDDLLAVAVYAREHVNLSLFEYAFSVALLHRPDTNDLNVPSLIESFPEKFIDTKTFERAREIAYTIPEKYRKPIEMPMNYTASDLDIEQRVAYFREDIGVNLHHWHWHLVYPTGGPPHILNKNRRGELFYYMHQQIVARYNFERLCNQLMRVDRFFEFDEPIKEAYFPKLDSAVSSGTWPARAPNQRIQNLRRKNNRLYLDINEMKRWRDRIFEAINTGVVKGEDGNDIILTENEGIDILGNLIEATLLSVNGAYYGNLHNMGHNIVAYIHDPDNKYLESNGVIGDSATAMRDPWFYRWHAYIDYIFQSFKSTLPRYTTEQLDYPGITIQRVQVETEGSPKNVFETFWQKSEVDLSGGLDFQPRGKIFVRFTHLQHTNFTYQITVNNQTKQNREGTCRIFLAPKYDETGTLWFFQQQKSMFIELDKFKVTCQSQTPYRVGLWTDTYQKTTTFLANTTKGVGSYPTSVSAGIFTEVFPAYAVGDTTAGIDFQLLNGHTCTPVSGYLASRQCKYRIPSFKSKRTTNNMFVIASLGGRVAVGSNNITRRSTESSVTIPFERTFRNIYHGGPNDGTSLDPFNFCGCGWPQHLLLPKGSVSPFECELFVMISDYAGDKIEQSIEGKCKEGGSYCGIKDKLYPDRRSMGYPFDRQARDGVTTLKQFLTPNMAVQDVSIRFTNETKLFKPRN